MKRGHVIIFSPHSVDRTLRALASRSALRDAPYIIDVNDNNVTDTKNDLDTLPTHSETQSLTQPARPEASPAPPRLDLPDDYRHEAEQSRLCTQRLGFDYLNELRQSRATYCSEQSKSQLTCFHSQTDKSGRVDSFCITKGRSKLNEARTTLETPCSLVEPWGVETNKPSLALQNFPRYWYETGPRTVMETFLNFTIEDVAVPPHQEEKFTVLVKREGITNAWHSLMEIMSLSMTFDVLQVSPDQSGRPFITANDASNIQVVILDHTEDGPYYDLWRLFSKKPTIRFADLPTGVDVGNLIVPLPGASNPIWQGDWEANECDHSELLRTFSNRVLKHYDIADTTERNERQNDKIVVTFIDRRGTRKLVDIEKHIEALRNKSTHAEVRLVDLATMSFVEQIQIVRDSDVLAGVHGAGLTHGMWLREHAVWVEIMPEDFQHKGFRNLAGALGHGYFRAHGVRPQSSGGEEKEPSWQTDDVAIDEDRFLELMDVAIKSVYTRGAHDFDVLK